MMNSVRRESVPYQLFMLALCVYTLLALAAEVILRPGAEIRSLLEYADTAICAVFLLDFIVCIYRAPNRWRYLYTWGWLDLASSIPTLDVARWGRAARAARIFRVLRGVRATKMLGSLALAKRAESAFLAVTLVAILLLIAASISILQVETEPQSNIRTADDALWWALSTITTVGYGDRYPVTSEGRVVAGLLMCAGVGLFGTLSGFLAAWFVEPAAKQEKTELEALKDEVRQLRALLEKTLGGSA
jgi:voltage-gated potassium channel